MAVKLNGIGTEGGGNRQTGEWVPQSAMVLAAGLGRRMQPLSDSTPKPLIAVAGKPLLDYCLDNLAAAGVLRIVVNVHYLAAKVEAHLKDWSSARPDGPEIIISDERDGLLDTGGGLAQALPHLGDDAFFLRNTDSFWLNGVQSNLNSLIQGWDPARMDALLLLAPTVRSVGYQGRGDFLLSGSGQLRRRPERTVAPYVYSGAAIIDPALFASCPDGPFSLNVLFDKAIEAGRLYGIRMGGLWINVENPPAIAQAEAVLLD